MPDFILDISLTGSHYYKLAKKQAVFDIWIPPSNINLIGYTPYVYTFNQNGERLPPFEWTDIHFQPAAKPQSLEGEYRIKYNNKIVAQFKQCPTCLMLSMYLLMPKSQHENEMIPHHVADAYLIPNQQAKPLVSHADKIWLSNIITYGTASLKGLIKNEPWDDWIARDMDMVFSEIINPDLIKLQETRFPKELDKFKYSPPFNAIRGLPHVPGTDNRGLYSGGSAQCMWYRDRHKNGKAATDEWLKTRLAETFRLRGRRDKQTWLEHKGLLAYPSSPEDEFCAIVQHCLLDPKPVKPKKHHAKVSGVFHNWAREAIEDVIRALGSHAATRRYVYDHRWEQRSDGTWFCNEVTDSNDIAFIIPGDCEDNNSTIYYLALQMIAADYDKKKDRVLYYAKACLLIAGVPVCVAGTSESPSEEDNSHLGSHLYGFFIPMKKFARLVWGDNVDKDDLYTEFIGMFSEDRPSREIFDIEMPMLMETIMFVTPNYLNITEKIDDAEKGAWLRTGHVDVFKKFMAFAHKHHESLVFPHIFGAEWPLALKGALTARDGFIVHHAVIKVFTDAITLMFSKVFRKYYQDRTLALHDGDVNVDPTLEYTCSFLAKCKNKYSVTVEEFHNPQVEWRLVTTKRFSREVYEADKRLMLLDRPFIPLDADPYQPPIYEKQPPYEEYKRFTVYNYKDRDNPELMKELGHALYKDKCRMEMRPFAWANAYIFFTE